METTITIDSDAVIRGIYALAALRYVNATDADQRPPLLTRGHEPLLAKAVSDQFAMLAAELVTVIDDLDTDTLSITMKPGAPIPPGALTAIRRAIEHILALRVMEAAMPPGQSARYATEASAAMVSLRITIAGTIPPPRSPRWL